MSGATVVVGTQPATVQQVTSNQILATSPPGSVGFATVTVTIPGGDSSSLADVFQYIAPPTVLSVVALDGPTAGEKRAPIAGGVTIQVTGLEFRDGIAFEVEGQPAVNVKYGPATALIMGTVNGIRYRECVSCDFFEQLPIEEQAAPELATRVNRPREEEESGDFQTVRILDPKGR